MSSGGWMDRALVMLPGDVELFDNILRQNFPAEEVICTMVSKLAVDLPTVTDEARFLNVLPTLAADGEWLKPDDDPFYLLDVGCLAEARHLVECGTFSAIVEPVVLARLELRGEEVQEQLRDRLRAIWPQPCTRSAPSQGDLSAPGR